MEFKLKTLNLLKYVCTTVFTIGILFFLFGLFEIGYRIFIPIGIGTVISSVFIFIIGIFFVATDEMLEKV